MANTFKGRIFRRYVAYFAGVISLVLIVSGATTLYFSYVHTRAVVDELQREKARGAAMRIEQFVRTLEAQIRAALLLDASSAAADERQLEMLRLLRLAPPVTDVAWLDVTGKERLRVSRLHRDAVDLEVDHSRDPAVVAAASTGETWYGPVYFRRESAPYVTLAVPGPQRELGLMLADVNLTFVGEVVSKIRVGSSGHAYVVDGQGNLISHPDLSQVLRQTNLAYLRQVKAALEADTHGEAAAPTIIGEDVRRAQTLTAYTRIEPLGWHVLVEQPLSEAFGPLYGHATRALIILVVGVLLGVGASVALARRLVDPIRTLESGVRRIGEGDLAHTLSVASGDELEDLARQFNLMARRLSESYAHLEDKIGERTAELAQANRVKSLFLAAASHDLRQPVHALGLYIAQLHEAGAGAQQQLVEKIAASHGAVSELLDSLLDISQLDAGGIEPKPAAWYLNQVFTRVEQAIAPAAEANELRLRVRPSRLAVFTDVLLLERIVLNLASNAVRYTKRGAVLIGARRRGTHVSIEVWDTGAGIPEDQIERIFDEFYRLPGASEGRARGLGLGLAIVARLARLLGAEVAVRSKLGRGSKFSVRVPLATTAVATVIALQRPATDAVFDGALVLVIDDDAAAREAAEGLLRRWGCRVLVAASGDEAERLLQHADEVPDVVISDYRLGNERGTAVIRRLRERCGAHLPGIVVSGDAVGQLRGSAEAEGLHLLQKPLQPARMRVLLQHALETGRRRPSVDGAVVGRADRNELVGIEP